MPSSKPILPPQTDEASLVRYVVEESESDQLDHKGPMAWDGGETAAGLAKDLLAFANSRGGGVIVIGVAESVGGGFERVGLTPAQAESFETTKVAAWINAKCEPSVNVRVARCQYQNKHFVLLFVAEFDDVPIICVSDFQVERGGRPVFLLKRGTVYLRGANSESRPLQTPEDVRRIVGLATSKKSDELLSRMQALLSGRELGPAALTVNEKLLGEMSDAVTSMNEVEQEGLWVCSFCPLDSSVELFQSQDELRKFLLETQAQYFGRSFPHSSMQLSAMEWGFVSVNRWGSYAISTTGVFVSRTPRYLERSQARPDSNGPRIDYVDAIFSFAERYKHAAKVSQRLAPSGQVRFAIEAPHLKGRTLVSTSPRVSIWSSDPTIAPAFSRETQEIAATFSAGWMDQCQAALRRFMTVMGHDISVQVIQNWLETFDQQKSL